MTGYATYLQAMVHRDEALKELTSAAAALGAALVTGPTPLSLSPLGVAAAAIRTAGNELTTAQTLLGQAALIYRSAERDVPTSTKAGIDANVVASAVGALGAAAAHVTAATVACTVCSPAAAVSIGDAVNEVQNADGLARGLFPP